MKSVLIILFFVVAGCGVKRSSVHYGKTTVADLISEKGEPLEEKALPVKDAKILLFQENEKFQTKDSIVTHGFKDPKGDEKSIIFWKHKFRDCETKEQKIGKVKGHELAEYELSCPAEGTSVIYTEGSEFVSRIVEYEKK